MKTIFLNEGLVKALEPYGICVNDVEATIPDPLSLLTEDDKLVVELQTQRMLSCPVFSNTGFMSGVGFNQVMPSPQSDDLHWDVFLKEGALSHAETIIRLRKCNCVVTQTGTLVFFEDESNVVNVIERALHAMTKFYSLDDVMQSPLWDKFKNIY